MLSCTRVLREALTDEIRRQAGNLHVLEACGSPAEAIRALRVSPQALVLIDAREGVEGTKAIRDRIPGACMIAFGVPKKARSTIASLIAHGVLGCLTEDAGVGDLMDAVDHATRDDARPSLAAGALRAGSIRPAGDQMEGTARAPRLTGREIEVALLLREGMSNKDIGRRLRISPATVKNHVHHILAKLQAGRRGEAVAQLQRTEALPPAALRSADNRTAK